jgi:hypothetical protein
MKNYQFKTKPYDHQKEIWKSPGLSRTTRCSRRWARARVRLPSIQLALYT